METAAKIASIISASCAAFTMVWNILLPIIRSKMKGAATNEASAIPWRKRQTVIMIVLVILAWIPMIVTWIYRDAQQPLPVRIMVTNTLLPDGRLSTKLDLREDKPDRKIMVVALHYYGTLDGSDQPGLQKSALFDYRSGEQTIITQPDAKFIHEAPNYTTNFYLINIPSGISETQFSTLRQAEKLGAYVTFAGANGPAACPPQLR
jgi:hypothetical protein